MDSPARTWASFTADPRHPEAASLRASDGDRDVALGVLAQGFAEGRLDHAEYDERSSAVTDTKTLGELAPIIEDLVPHHAPRPAHDLALATPDDLQARAVAAWEAQRRRALSGFLVPTLVCWVIWLASSLAGSGFTPQFPWPLFVMLGTGAGAARTLLHRTDIVEEERRKLEKRQRKALERGSEEA